MKVRGIIFFILLVNFSSYSQNKLISSEETIDWINSKLKTYKSFKYDFMKLEIDNNELILYMVGKTKTMHIFQLYKINFSDIVNFHTQTSGDVINIFIDLKPNALSTSYTIPKQYTALSNADFETILSSKSIEELGADKNGHSSPRFGLIGSSKNEDIPDRIIRALNNIAKNEGIVLVKDKF